MKRTPEPSSTENGKTTDAWIWEELLGDDDVDEGPYKHVAGELSTLEDAPYLVHLRGATGLTRMERHDGKDYLVVPVIALMEGVVQAINAPHAEFVPGSLLSAAPNQWDGRPVVLGHPTDGTRQISANRPKVLEAQGIGFLNETRCLNGKLLTEAWIDVQKCERLGNQGREVLRKLNGAEPVEVSVGAFVNTLAGAGEYKGKKYAARWASIASDHLAFLPLGRGACSLEMGCGALRAAEEATFEMGDAMKILGGKGSGNFGHAGRPGHVGGSADDHTVNASDVKREFDEENEREQANKELDDEIASKKLEDYTPQMQERIKETVLTNFRDGMTPTEIGQDMELPRDMVTGILKSGGFEASYLDKVEASAIKSMTPLAKQANQDALATARAQLAESVKFESTMKARGYGDSLDVKAARIRQGDLIKLINKLETKLPSSKKVLAQTRAEAARKKMDEYRSDGEARAKGIKRRLKNLGEETNMTKEQREATIKTLMGCDCSGFTDANLELLQAADDSELEQFRANSERVKAERAELKAAKASAEILQAQVTALSEKKMTEDEFMAAAPESLKTLITGAQAAAEAEKNELVSTLKTCQTIYTEDELKALEVSQLQKLAKLAKVEPSFKGKAVPRVAAAGEDFSAPDPWARKQ